ncbi:helix-turn-helix transcriptional regulator [Azospirillum sp. RWY-5-1]|uniref:Helix-turn-helix transcriptional regulator n=1 Tax=Azospirillum oleiclasticum TaxID=2735135 RepID=A0ABX2TEX6_9PROT|nr:helix-turn-helix transcriptional regulator [Azospirillum oleiclasticum]NYZ15051.1 helix-turn-helix transcriptional regulator [Azospirillum oleiclasticum]NYZ22813.1 helix-turn-helix transcriptional regulator [Azospirillum oleiclasticum]
MTHLGPALRRMRRLRGMKQSHVAELAGVTQATVSRWEAGSHRPDPEQALRLTAFLQARLDGVAERALKRLVETSALPVHLICDVTHRLFAASAGREREWTRGADTFIGDTVWPYACDEIREAEARLPDIGWYDPAAVPVASWHGANGHPVMRILPGLMVWERMVLADGTAVRLCTTVEPDRLDALYPDRRLLRASPC